MHPTLEVTEDLQMVEEVPIVSEGAGSEAMLPLSGLSPGGAADASAEGQGAGALVFTIHDGSQVPRDLFGERSEEVLARSDVETAYVQERDWGANLVARHLAREIGSASYLRVNLARAVMDFGRFPGCSSVGAEYLRRHAVFPPIEQLLSEEQRHEMLARYYDSASQAFVQHFSDKLITVAVHSYDPTNRSGTRRPEVGLVTRSLEYQLNSTMPPYIFDPLFPPELCEATCQRLVTYQALADLERDGWYTALNYPYIMPEGSVEIRAQVWFFFRYLRREFSQAFPQTLSAPAYQRVWQMLLDVVRRSAESERLRGTLHRYREAPRGSEALFAEARKAYREIARFLTSHRADLLDRYRFTSERLSCLGIEIRKDLLCQIEGDRVVGMRDEAAETAQRIASRIAPAVRSYLAEHSHAAKISEQAPTLREAVPLAATLNV